MKTSAQPTTLEQAARLQQAAEAFRRYRTRCFWYLREDLPITADDLPWLVEGLRRHGDRAAFLLAGRLCR